jgi:hypothetical protein
VDAAGNNIVSTLAVSLLFEFQSVTSTSICRGGLSKRHSVIPFFGHNDISSSPVYMETIRAALEHY